jgi:RimJ/RimL family protein N-acetyltransferase
MDDKIIQRIDALLERIDYVRIMMDGASFNTFVNDRKLLDATAFSILQIGESMIKFEHLLKDKYPEIPWAKAKAMRNVIAHDYGNADPKIIYRTATTDLPDLKKLFLKVKDDVKQISENSLYTERLWLRPWDDVDAKQLFELAKDPEIGYWCGWEPHKTRSDSLFAIHNFLQIKETYAICLKDSGSVIGSIGLKFDVSVIQNIGECELGFWIGKQYQRNGYAFEAASEVLRHAFIDLKTETVWCCYFEGNDKSKFLQEKLGFAFFNKEEKEGRKRFVNILTKDKWLARQ